MPRKQIEHYKSTAYDELAFNINRLVFHDSRGAHNFVGKCAMCVQHAKSAVEMPCGAYRAVIVVSDARV